MVQYQEEWHFQGIYVAVLFSVILRTLGYLGLIFGIRETKFSQNIPYATLAMDFFAILILFGIAFQRKYYIHLTLYLIQFLLIIYIIMAKLDLEGQL